MTSARVTLRRSSTSLTAHTATMIPATVRRRPTRVATRRLGTEASTPPTCASWRPAANTAPTAAKLPNSHFAALRICSVASTYPLAGSAGASPADTLSLSAISGPAQPDVGPRGAVLAHVDGVCEVFQAELVPGHDQLQPVPDPQGPQRGRIL